jgi:hypothetical protein
MHRFYKAYNLIIKLLFFTLYILFFGVQLLFNFDAVSEDQLIDTELHAHASFHNRHFFHQSVYTHNTSQQGDNIRLNKRYQPETVAIITLFVLTVSPLIFFRVIYSYYKESFVSFLHHTTTLRGPPVSMPF